MTTQPDYPYIRRWGQLMGSYRYYIDGQVGQARADNAPTNATHRRQDGTWATTDDITRAQTRRELGLEPLPPQPPDRSDVAQHLQALVRRSEYLQDHYGLVDVDQAGDGRLVIRLATGWTVELTIQLYEPAPPA
jgi:hypothetical protein